jgi:hypothetical protein
MWSGKVASIARLSSCQGPGKLSQKKRLSKGHLIPAVLDFQGQFWRRQFHPKLQPDHFVQLGDYVWNWLAQGEEGKRVVWARGGGGMSEGRAGQERPVLRALKMQRRGSRGGLSGDCASGSLIGSQMWGR